MKTAEQNFQMLQEIEDGRELLLMACEQNPQLLERAEPRVRELLGAVTARQDAASANVMESQQRGISLIELIIFIVIISVALTGILLVMNQVTAHSADPLIHKQAMAVAESLLEEIELQDFSPPSGVTSAGAMNAADDRTAGYHTVLDYHQFPLDNGMGIYPLNGGTPITGLENYKVKVVIDSTMSPLGSGAYIIAAGSAVRIRVKVTTPQNEDIAIDGYRTKY